VTDSLSHTSFTQYDKAGRKTLDTYLGIFIVIATNIIFSVLFFILVVKRISGDIWETDCATWVRALSGTNDTIVRRPDLLRVERVGPTIILIGARGQIFGYRRPAPVMAYYENLRNVGTPSWLQWRGSPNSCN
jgi:hypothetical protein